jgi:hypothetical protein
MHCSNRILFDWRGVCTEFAIAKYAALLDSGPLYNRVMAAIAGPRSTIGRDAGEKFAYWGESDAPTVYSISVSTSSVPALG